VNRPETHLDRSIRKHVATDAQRRALNSRVAQPQKAEFQLPQVIGCVGRGSMKEELLRYAGKGSQFCHQRRAAAIGTKDNTRVYGYCVNYEEASEDLGGFVQLYARGSFRESLANAKDDQRILFNHNSSSVLGRKSAGTARFAEIGSGVYFEADVPACGWALDLMVSMQRRDVNQSGVWAIPTKAHWESRGERTLVIDQASLIAASVVSFATFGRTTADVNAGENAAMAASLEYLRRIFA
jgi:HK97 family phage prohead protease